MEWPAHCRQCLFAPFRPLHEQIQPERQTWPLAKGGKFIDNTQCHKEPLYAEYQPAKPTAYYTYGNGGVGAGYHHVDADMVALAQGTLQFAWRHHVIYRTGQEHQEHAHDEEDDAKAHLPPLFRRWPDEPDTT